MLLSQAEIVDALITSGSALRSRSSFIDQLWIKKQFFKIRLHFAVQVLLCFTFGPNHFFPNMKYMDSKTEYEVRWALVRRHAVLEVPALLQKL